MTSEAVESLQERRADCCGWMFKIVYVEEGSRHNEVKFCFICVFAGFGVQAFCSKFPLRSAPDLVSSVVKGV